MKRTIVTCDVCGEEFCYPPRIRDYFGKDTFGNNNWIIIEDLCIKCADKIDSINSEAGRKIQALIKEGN